MRLAYNFLLKQTYYYYVGRKLILPSRRVFLSARFSCYHEVAGYVDMPY